MYVCSLWSPACCLSVSPQPKLTVSLNHFHRILRTLLSHVGILDLLIFPWGFQISWPSEDLNACLCTIGWNEKLMKPLPLVFRSHRDSFPYSPECIPSCPGGVGCIGQQCGPVLCCSAPKERAQEFLRWGLFAQRCRLRADPLHHPWGQQRTPSLEGNQMTCLTTPLLGPQTPQISLQASLEAV
jgi:hypothetical protein